MRIMGLDIGSKKIGVALSDQTGQIASASEVISRKSDSVAICRIKQIAEEFNVKKIVVGLPVNMDGSYGPSAKMSEKFAEKIKKEIEIDICFWDERLSTKEAENIMISASVSRKKRKGVIDKLAAQIILQGYLDRA
ncbi:MAG: Holliday junction resolvase RuvX [Candidatus Omnitrophica bacterium]|nr:Holliday junction resolvase RuvX [Candidatus Omnitrophota bacterium]